MRRQPHQTLLPAPGGHAPDADPLIVGPDDAAMAGLIFALSAVVFWLAMRGTPIMLIAAMHGGVVCVALAFLGWRVRTGGQLSVPFLLLIVTAVSGALGAAGCAAMTVMLWRRRPDADRLQHWYDYLAGVGQRTLMEETYVELTSERLRADFAAPVHRFDPILSGTSLTQQQRVLGLIGRNYHPDFQAGLKKALRSRNILVRAQAAAIASLLAPEEKARLWQPSAAKSLPAERGPIEAASRIES